MPDTHLFLNTFKPAVWFSLAISLLAAALAYTPIHHASSIMSQPAGHITRIPFTRYEQLTMALTYALRLPGTMLSRPERGFGGSWAERILLTVALWHAVLMPGIFQGQLFDAYTHPQTAANVNTIAELVALPDMRLAIRHRNSLTDVMGVDGSYSTPVLRQLHDRVVYKPTNMTAYETVLAAPNVADIDRLLHFQLMQPLYRRYDGYSKLHALTEYPM